MEHSHTKGHAVLEDQARAFRNRMKLMLTDARQMPRRTASCRGRTRVPVRGMSLIEVMIVVAIIAIVTGAVAVLAMEQLRRARIETAHTAVRTVRTAAQAYFTTDVSGACPSMGDLVSARLLDSGSATADPWGSGFLVACEGEDITVSSPGPDRAAGTTDDIVIPMRRPSEG